MLAHFIMLAAMASSTVSATGIGAATGSGQSGAILNQELCIAPEIDRTSDTLERDLDARGWTAYRTLPPSAPGLTIEATESTIPLTALRVGNFTEVQVYFSASPGAIDPAAGRTSTASARLMVGGTELCTQRIPIPERGVYWLRYRVNGLSVGRTTLWVDLGLDGWASNPTGARPGVAVISTDPLPVIVAEPYEVVLDGPDAVRHGQAATAQLAAVVHTSRPGATAEGTVFDGDAVSRVSLSRGRGLLNVIASASLQHSEACAYHTEPVELRLSPNAYRIVMPEDVDFPGYVHEGTLDDLVIVDHGLPPPDCPPGASFSRAACGCVEELDVEDDYTGSLVGVRGNKGFFAPPDVDLVFRDPSEPAGDMVELSLVKVASVATAAPGDTVTYGIVVRNNGEQAATEVVISDPLQLLPVALTRIETSLGRCFSFGELRCEIDRLEPGHQVDVTIDAVFSEQAETGAYLNRAAVAAAQNDRTPLDNQDEVTVTLVNRRADLAIEKVDSADPVQSGDEFDYIISVGNLGQTSARNVVITDQLPTAVDFVSVSQPALGFCSHNAGVITCDLQQLDVGVQVEIVVRVRVFAGYEGPLENTVTVDSDDPDPDRLNNTASEGTTVQGSGSLCALGIEPGNYQSDSFPGCGIGDALFSCNSPADVIVTSPSATLLCDVLGNCGNNNTIFGQPDHVCAVENLGGGRTRVRCTQVVNGQTVGQCTEDFSLLGGGR